MFCGVDGMWPRKTHGKDIDNISTVLLLIMLYVGLNEVSGRNILGKMQTKD